MTEQPIQQKNILWVEDDYYHLKYLARRLPKYGFRVFPARSFIEAKDLLSKYKFDLILLDLIIPYTDDKLTSAPISDNLEVDSILASNGVALFDYIISEKKFIIPIILLTVVMTQSLIDELIRRGATTSIHKSGLIPDDIERVVTETLEKYNSEHIS